MANNVQVEVDIPQSVNYQSCTVQAGTTTTLASDQNATVTNSGTVYNAVLDFGIPRGKSAYEQAVEGGYPGTEEEFNAAIGQDVQIVSDNISDVNAVGQNISNVTAVANNETNINTVAGVSSDVTTVAGISSDVTQVASISTAVSAVSGHDSEVTLVADNMASVMTTASSITDVQNVASDITNINTVAGISSDVSTVATNSTAVNTAATNIAAIIAAPTAATNAANSAAEAQIWAEGTDGQVSPLGGEHSSKGWAGIAKQYAESIGTALKYKGSVSTYSALPSTGQEIGDFWNVLDTGKNYAWTGTEWDDVSGIMDLSAYRTAAAQDVIDSGKQATLVSGTNIKTVNSTSLLGSGDITIDSLPSQTGQSGKFLTTDGTDASWANVDALPSQTGQNGKFLTTNGSAASWAAVDALPSQTGNQGKFLTTDGSSASWGVPTAGFPLFYHTFQDHILNNSSWLRSDTNSWQSGAIYVSAYNHLVDDIDGITSETETIAGTTITFKRATDGHKIVDDTQVSNVEAIYTATGVAWYYILDTTNTRFKLPRSSHGNIVEKYQNGTSWYRVYSDGWCEQGGTITGDYVQVNLSKSYANTNYNIQVTMDSSYESSASFAAIGVRGSVTTSYFELWGGSTIGYKFWKTSGYISNPPENAQYKYLYFFVGNTIQNETSVDVAELAEDLNGKADIDLGNLSNSGKSTSAHLAMPSDTYDDLTLGASGNTYTMPSDGYLCLFMNMTGAYSNMAIINAATGRSQYQYAGGSIGLAITMAVHKSEVMTVYYGAAGSATKKYFRFYYAEGSKSEQ